MSYRDVVAGLGVVSARYRRPRRWIAWLALCAVGCATAAAAYRWLAAPTRAPTRIASRVECSDAAACALAETIAIDVWSEHRGAGLPLDIVVTDDALARLDAAGARWQVLVPDIDAVARAESA